MKDDFELKTLGFQNPSQRRFQFIESVQKLASRIEGSWARFGWKLEEFHKVACQVLSESRLHDTFAQEEIVSWIASTEKIPQQRDPSSRFGSPSLTVWSGERFVVDLYFWIDADTSLHDHGFAGAFVNLLGNSLQSKFVFNEYKKIADGVSQGCLLHELSEYVRPGEVYPILAGPSLIHGVWHLSAPTVTLAARTYSTNTTQQREYSLSGIAVDNSLSYPSMRAQRSRELFLFFLRSNHPKKMLMAREIAKNASPVECFWYLQESENPVNTSDRTVFSGVAEEIENRFGPDFLTAFRLRQRYLSGQGSVNRGVLQREEERLMRALIFIFRDHDQLAEWARHAKLPFDWQCAGASFLVHCLFPEQTDERLLRMWKGVFLSMIRGTPDNFITKDLEQRFLLEGPAWTAVLETARGFGGREVLAPLFPRPS